MNSVKKRVEWARWVFLVGMGESEAVWFAERARRPAVR